MRFNQYTEIKPTHGELYYSRVKVLLNTDANQCTPIFF